MPVQMLVLPLDVFPAALDEDAGVVPPEVEPERPVVVVGRQPVDDCPVREDDAIGRRALAEAVDGPLRRIARNEDPVPVVVERPVDNLGTIFFPVDWHIGLNVFHLLIGKKRVVAVRGVDRLFPAGAHHELVDPVTAAVGRVVVDHDRLPGPPTDLTESTHAHLIRLVDPLDVAFGALELLVRVGAVEPDRRLATGARNRKRVVGLVVALLAVDRGLLRPVDKVAHRGASQDRH